MNWSVVVFWLVSLLCLFVGIRGVIKLIFELGDVTVGDNIQVLRGRSAVTTGIIFILAGLLLAAVGFLALDA